MYVSQKNRMYFRCIQKTLSTANDEDIKSSFMDAVVEKSKRKGKVVFPDALSLFNSLQKHACITYS